MKTNTLLAGVLLFTASLAGPLLAQGQVERLPETPVFRVDVVARTAKAVNYRHRGGATKIDFKGTSLLPRARGEAKVESKQGYIEIEVEYDNLSPARQFGPEYLTYVLWAITPEGRAKNLGEILLNGTKSKLNVTTEFQAFGLVVTAEPYFAVSQPSDVVVLENMVRTDTLGKVELIDAKYELLQRGQYTVNIKPETLGAFTPGGKIPLELIEARNAVQIARGAGADQYAKDTFDKAIAQLQQAEGYLARKQAKPTVMSARESVQTAEDSRLIAVKRIEEEKLAQERQAAAEREAKAKAETEAELQRRTIAEQQRQEEEARRRQAEVAANRAREDADAAARRAADERARLEKATAEFEAASRKAAEERTALEAARNAALSAQQSAQEEAERQRLAAENAERERAALKERLRAQLNAVLETRTTARGLIVNMSDVLFDFGKSTLKPGAREKLAKVSGILLGHPGLKVQVEGHTDAIGSEEFNQVLSEKRAGEVEKFLTDQGIPRTDVTAKGFGKTMPVASNDTATGRQQNRRVELVVSGEAMGVPTVDSAAR